LSQEPERHGGTGPEGRGGTAPEAGGPVASPRRARRDHPLLIVHTGRGKGKSTAAFGLMLRAWARGYRVGMYQFVKSGKWKVGERKAAEALGDIDWESMGDGWTWVSRDLEQSADLAREGWEEVKRRIADQTYDLLILDEFTYPMTFGWVDTDEVVAVLRDRPGFQHVVVTGRDAPAALVDAADLVTEMRKVKHPFDEGVRGQQGIEW
jgi:cob(I)alamin adenosyltransferase